MSRNYRRVKFINLSMSSLGVFSDECSRCLDMMNDIGIDKKQQLYIIKKMINIAIRVACEQQERSYDRKCVCCSQATIRATYYIFCCRNRNWDSPDLMQFWFLFFSFFLLSFFLSLLLLNITSFVFFRGKNRYIPSKIWNTSIIFPVNLLKRRI